MKNTNINRRQKLLGGASLAAMVVAPAHILFPMTSALYPENVIQHVTGYTTTEERKIEAALRDSLGVDVWVNCTNSYQSQSVLSREDGPTAMAAKTGHMTLPEAVCKDVVSFAKDPEGFKSVNQVTVEDLGINPEDYGLSSKDIQNQLSSDETRLGDASRAYHVLSHEAAHTYGVMDESDAECFSFQAADSIMQSMGVQADIAARVASYGAKNYEDVRGKEYAITAECNPQELNYDLPNAHWPLLS